MKVKKTYRLEQETIDELEKLCSDSGKSATEVIEGAITGRALYEASFTLEQALDAAAGR